MSGRKSLREEIQITRRYSDLSEKAFKKINKYLGSDNETDVKFALDWLKGGFARMIPQKLGGDPDNRTPIPLLYAIRNNNGGTETLPAK